MDADTHVLTPDTQAALLLCATLGQRGASEVKPLSQSEYNRLAQWLHQNDLRPADLLQPDTIELLQHEELPVPYERLVALLERGGALAFSVEQWTNRGGWVLSRSDPAYPKRLKTHFGNYSPPILYGVGDAALLEMGGLAVVGSRDVEEQGLEFTRTVARCCAQQGIQVVSGGARGVDSEAMQAALEAGGKVVGVLANDLAKLSVSGKYRAALRDGQLALVSPYDPGAGFNVGNAMARNKYIYRLSDWSLVISSTENKGGTWEGAIENLKHRWVPLFVRAGENAPNGNQRLIELGGHPLAASALQGDLRTQFQAVLEERATTSQNDAEKPVSQLIESTTPSIPAGQIDLFEIVWPHLGKALIGPKSIDDLKADFINLHKTQLQAWLKHAVKEGLVREDRETQTYSLIPPKAEMPNGDSNAEPVPERPQDASKSGKKTPQQVSMFEELEAAVV